MLIRSNAVGRVTGIARRIGWVIGLPHPNFEDGGIVSASATTSAWAEHMEGQSVDRALPTCGGNLELVRSRNGAVRATACAQGALSKSLYADSIL